MQMNLILYTLCLLFGAIIGSFLNVVIYRLRIEKTGKAKANLWGRSKCPKCKKELQWYELIPVISFLVLGAKCAKCKNSISWQYPVVEISSAILTFLPFYYLGFNNIFAYITVLIMYIFIIIFFYDLNNYIIPDIVLVPLFILVLVFDIIKLQKHLIEPQNILLGLIIGGGIFFVFVYLSREKWMGWGDVKLGLILGLLLAYPYIVVSYFIAFIAGALVSLLLIVLKKKKLKSEIPFAPFLIISAIIVLFYGEQIINWYLSGF